MDAVRGRIAVLMTCHNRRDKTLACLRSLFAQEGVAANRISVFLVDDGSTDGTADAVSSEFPTTRVLRGDGSLYWTGGMRVAMDAAMREGSFDYYAWLNDDTLMYADALQRLLTTYEQLAAGAELDPIVVGSLRDPESGECTYGGSVSDPTWHRLRFRLIEPGDVARQCDVANGNLLLMSGRAAVRLGNLHPKLLHAGGDYDYSLRARKMGHRLWVAPGYFGECPRNRVQGTWLDPDLPLLVRYRKLLSPKGHPLRARAHFVAGHGGLLWPLVYASVYVTLPFRHLLAKISRR